MKAEMRILVVLSTFLLAAAPVASAGKTIYVDADVGAGGDGASWATAFRHLQDALAVAEANDEIRVAQGTYMPDRSSADPDGRGDREATFQLIGGVAIYGGYAGYGVSDPDDRDVDAYETILSGDLSGDDVLPFSPEHLLDEPTRSDNCYHVVTSEMMVMFETIVLDGLTITAGHANDIEHPGNCGGGMYNEYNSPTIVDCTFKDNCARFRGGGMYCSHLNFAVASSISSCVFIGNSAGYGAGIFNDRVDATVSVANCVFTGNFATDRGGGMYNYETDANVANCVFTNNSAANEGGAVFNRHEYPKLTNCIISGNYAGRNGGGIGNDNLELSLTNCTIIGNEAGEQGGGVFSYYGSDLYVTNCILWDNSAYEGPQMATTRLENAFIRYSCFQGGLLDIHDGGGSVSWADSNNTDADPMFVDAGHWNLATWVDGDYHLRSRIGRWDPGAESWVVDANTSPCVDAGDPNSEWMGELWPHGQCINMGAFGGTPQGSMSESSLGSKADLGNNGFVNFVDFARLTDSWQAEGPLRAEDLNRDAIVNFFDILQFVEEWLWQEI